MLTYPGLIDRLRTENFDAALSETFEWCAFRKFSSVFVIGGSFSALFLHLGITKIAGVSSQTALEMASGATGIATVPSYVPCEIFYYETRFMFFVFQVW